MQDILAVLEITDDTAVIADDVAAPPCSLSAPDTAGRRIWRVSVRMPSYHSDHRALVAVIYAEREGELKRYRRRTQQFPLSLPRGPWTQLDAGY